jgi:O-antigen ligase
MFFYYLFLLLAPFQDHPKLGAVLFDFGFIPVTPIKVVGILMVAAALLAPRPANAARPIPTAIPGVYAAFLGFPLFGAIVRGQPPPAASLSALVSYGLLLIATRRLIATRERARNSIRVLVLAEAIGTLWIFKQYYFLHWPRPVGPSSDENYEALSLVMALPLAIWLASRDEHRIWRRFGGACAPLLAFSVFVTQSRGGLLALLMLAAAGWLHCSRKLATMLFIVTVLGVDALLAPRGIWSRLQETQVWGSPASGPAVSTRARIELWKGGLSMMQTHPLLGVGLDRFKGAVGRYNPKVHEIAHSDYIAHNTYIQEGAEGGLPTLALFLALISLAMANCRDVERQQGKSEGGLIDLGSAMRLGLFAYTVGAFFLTAQFIKEFWLFVFLSHNLREIVAADVARQGTAGAASEGYRHSVMGLPALEVGSRKTFPFAGTLDRGGR